MMQQEPQPLGAPLWKVGVPRQTKIADPSRGMVDAWEIPIVLVDKSSFTITVSHDDFTPDKVSEVIKEYIDRLTMVRALEGPIY